MNIENAIIFVATYHILRTMRREEGKRESTI